VRRLGRRLLGLGLACSLVVDLGRGSQLGIGLVERRAFAGQPSERQQQLRARDAFVLVRARHQLLQPPLSSPM